MVVSYWYAKKWFLKRTADVYDEVFTYNKTEIRYFSKYIKRGLSDKKYIDTLSLQRRLCKTIENII
jgi:hypothetical protein